MLVSDTSVLVDLERLVQTSDCASPSGRAIPQGEIAKFGSISASYHVDGSDERDVDPCRLRD